MYGSSNDEDEKFMVEEEDNDGADFMSMLPVSVSHRVEKLMNLNTERDFIIQEYLVERAALEQKYAKICKGLYDMRLEIINGSQDKIIEEEFKVQNRSKSNIDDSSPYGSTEEQTEEFDETSSFIINEDNEENLVGVPEFWYCSMRNIETVAELITERDCECLLNLEDICSEDFLDGKGFTLRFKFNDYNPFFYNKVLTKRYEVPNLLLDDEPILKNVVGCGIQWKPNMCLTEKEVTKKQRSKSGKRAGQIRTTTKKERTDSFFHFFSPIPIPTSEMDEDEADAFEEALEHDYDVAQSFRSFIIPKAVLWFTGESY